MRIGILTGGGDTPGTNAVIRALARALAGTLTHGGPAELIGIEDGYLGLIERRVQPLDLDRLDAALALGGTLLGSTNRASPLDHHGRDVGDAVIAYARELGLDGLVAIGGDGTLTIADALHRRGLPTIGVPKTIDNDIAGVARSFGFDTAVARVTEAIDRIRTTGASMRRVMLVETMGRHAGWIALEAGLAAGADIILLPEIDHDIEAVAALCRARERHQRFTLVCVAEGAKAVDGGQVVRARVAGAPEPERLGGIAERLALQLQDRIDGEARATVLGHVQRGGEPTAADRLLSTRYGVAAAALVREGAWGRMVVLADGAIASAPLAAAAGQRRRVPLDHPLLACARTLGVSLGEPA